MIKEDGSTPVSFPLVTLKWTIWGGGGPGYSWQTMNFVLLMLLDVNRVNAKAYPELQIRGGAGGRGGGGGWRGGGGGCERGAGGGGGAGPYPGSAAGMCFCHLMHGSVRCIVVVVVVCLSSFLLLLLFFFSQI